MGGVALRSVLLGLQFEGVPAILGTNNAWPIGAQVIG